MSHKEQNCISCNKLCPIDFKYDIFKCPDCGKENRILTTDKCWKCNQWFELYVDELDHVYECNRCYFEIPNIGMYMRKNENLIP